MTLKGNQSPTTQPHYVQALIGLMHIDLLEICSRFRKNKSLNEKQRLQLKQNVHTLRLCVGFI